MRAPQVNQHSAAGFAAVGLLIGFTPILMALLPWDFGREFGAYRAFVRGYGLAVPLIEIAIIGLFLWRGGALEQLARALPRSTLLLFAALAIWAAISAIVIAEYRMRALLSLPIWLIHALFALVIFEIARQSDAIARARFALLLAVGVALYWLLWTASFLWFIPRGEQWITHVPGMPNVRSLGFVACFGWFAAMAALPASAEQRAQAICATLLGAIALSLAFWTGSRGAVFAICIGSGIALIFAKGNRLPLAAFMSVGAAIALLGSLLLPVPHASYGFFRMADALAGRVEDPSSGRMLLWQLTLERILERPWSGWGLDQFKISGPELFLGYNQPHNAILQALFSVGLIGAGLLAAFAFSVLKRARPDFSSIERVAAFAAIMAATVFSLYDAALYYNYPLMMLAVAAAGAFTPPSAPASGR